MESRFESLPIITEQESMARQESGSLIPVPVWRIPEMEKEFSKLAKRASRKLKAEAPKLIPVARGDVSRTGEGNRRFTIPCVYFRAEGNPVKLKGWTLAARLDPLDSGRNLVMTVPGSPDIPTRFRNSGTHCEHCEIQRFRKETFVCHNPETGEFRQVGRSCLRDFLGHDPARLLASFFAYLKLDESARDYAGGHSFANIYETRHILEIASAAIRVEGWISRAEERDNPNKLATAGIVGSYLHDRMKRPDLWSRYDPEDSDIERAAAVLDWIRGDLAKRDNLGDYLYNLVAACEHDGIDGRAIGIAVSGIAAYMREKNREIERAKRVERDKASDHIGEIKERLREIPVCVDFVKPMSSDFGALTLIKFRAECGAILTWFASGDIAIQTGEEGRLTGTVKRHSEYNGIRETVLNRCVFVPKEES